MQYQNSNGGLVGGGETGWGCEVRRADLEARGLCDTTGKWFCYSTVSHSAFAACFCVAIQGLP